jgi:ATP-binding cassette subfamily B protein
MIIVPVKSARKGDKQGGEVRKAFGAVSALVVDGVQGLKDIISFQWHKPFYERYNAAAQKHFAAQLTFAMRSANETRWLQLITGVGGLCGQIAAAALVISGKVNAIWLIPVFSLSSAVFSPLYEALSLSTNYGLIFGAAKRVFDLFQAKPSVEDSGTLGVSDVLNDNPVTVSFENVSFTYPARDDMSANARVLEGLRFSVKAGETVALTGASGSGKTTAAKLLQRFWDADDGRIMINGVDVRELRLDALREIITVVPQDAYLFHASVEENLKMAKPSATHEELRRAAADARADLFIEKLPQGYGTMVGERGLRLSGGEKQRLSIAQAFLKDSPVLVLDEASANLDSENESRINEAVSRLKAGRATIVIAHRVSTIKAADRVIVLRDGRVEAEGVFDKLVAECPYFRELIGGEYREEA